jgi:outer membrane protein OmpA-like peptidoglycan-associated protein
MKSITVADNYSVPGQSQVSESADARQVMLDQLAMAQVTDLARRGRFAEAEGLIDELWGEPDNLSPLTLDLLGRIRCQQGRFHEAEVLWSKALGADPDNESYRAGLRRIAKMRRQPVWLASLVPLLVGLLVLAAVAISMFVIGRRLNQLRESISEQNRTLALARPSGEQSGAGANANQPPRPAKAKSVLVQLPGVSTQDIGDSQLLTFDHGLFDRGAVLKPEAQSLLSALAGQLQSHSNTTVRIIGHTDNSSMRRDSPFADNFDLGMSRAQTVFDYFRQHTSLPAQSLSVASAGDADAPFPNDNRENRMKNQTVTLSVSH